jgi:hypothetical protein
MHFNKLVAKLSLKISVTRPDIGHRCPAGGQSGHAPMHFNKLVAKLSLKISGNTCAHGAAK